MSKTFLVLLDGCGHEAATENLGFLEHLVEHGLGAKYQVRGELPSSSRPIYASILTGLPVHQHKITSNAINQQLEHPTVFDLAVGQGLVTAASAYSWISELCVRSPFDLKRDRIQLGTTSAIQHGIYYADDHYPDSHVFADADFLIHQYAPDFLLVHPMNIDDSGHKHGLAAFAHHRAINQVNELLAVLLPKWLEAGYQVVITADHGMNSIGLHGGNTQVQRQVPLYIFAEGIKTGDHASLLVPQLAIAPLICALLKLGKAPGMSVLEEFGVDYFAN